MKRFLELAMAATAVFLSTPAQAYWDFGHEQVARIAEANIRPSTRAAVRELLSHRADLQTPECPVSTMADAATWADCIKPLRDAAGNQRFRYAYNWHFQDVNVCEPFTLDVACLHGDCVSAQIDRDVATLRDRSRPEAERVEALAFLLHFVGDLHQPLHVGEKNDRGGNDVAASYNGYAPPHFNLHSIWDGPLAERAASTGPSLIRRYSAAERRPIVAGTVQDWSREGWQVSHDSVYGSIDADPCAPNPAHYTMDNATIDRLVPVVRLELERGGLRLARLLDEALG